MLRLAQACLACPPFRGTFFRGRGSNWWLFWQLADPTSGKPGALLGCTGAELVSQEGGGLKDRGRVSTIRAEPWLPDRTVTSRSALNPGLPAKGTLTFDIYGYACDRQKHVDGSESLNTTGNGAHSLSAGRQNREKTKPSAPVSVSCSRKGSRSEMFLLTRFFSKI